MKISIYNNARILVKCKYNKKGDNMKHRLILLFTLAFIAGFSAKALTSEEIQGALDCDFGTFSVSGEGDWSIDEGTMHNGGTSIKGNNLPVTSSWHSMAITISVDIKEPSRLSFWTKGNLYGPYDTEVSVNHTSYFYSYNWTKHQYVLIPGIQTIEVSYKRRSYNTSNTSYCFWVDDFKLEPISTEKPKVIAVKDITCTQRTPWNGMVDIDYTVEAEDENADIWVFATGYDKDSNTTMAPRTLTGEGVNTPVKPGTHRMTWNVSADYPNFRSTAFTVKMSALTGANPYMVVDLSGGVNALSYPVTYLSSIPEGGWSDEYKTTKMVFRLIPPGSFMMGSPSDQWGRDSYEDYHGVVLTKPLYVGVFECTQKQYELVMGSNPSNYKGDMRPVEQVSYANIRGSVNGAAWPQHNQVDANSFMGRLRSKANMLFDLPTEAQWEYACHAGTSTSLNNGKDASNSAACKEVARCNDNKNDGKGGYNGQHTKVGSYLENAWGLYDMHGNVCEFCLDYFHSYQGGLGYLGDINPKGKASVEYSARAYKGGDFGSGGNDLRPAKRRSSNYGNALSYVGFRIVCHPVAE